MTEHQEHGSETLHWHVFRQEEHGGKQYMLPFYSKYDDAVAAVAGLKMNDPREYGVEECQDQTCQK
jgi:hypothetical protein